MKMYKELRGHPEDFIVSYTLFPESEGGRKATYQHLRCDFLYAGDDPVEDAIYMIHPEFLDESGQPRGLDSPVPLEGHATMWVIVPEMREKVHRARIKVGTEGYFVEGARKIGKVRVEKIVGLYTNGT